MEIVTKNRIYFQKQDIQFLQRLKNYSLPHMVFKQICELTDRLEVTPQNKKEFLSIEGEFKSKNIKEYEFARLYNEIKLLTDDQLQKLIKLAIKEKNDALKEYNMLYEKWSKEYIYLFEKRRRAEYKLIFLREIEAIRNGELDFSLPNHVSENDIPGIEYPEEKSFIKRLFHK